MPIIYRSASSLINCLLSAAESGVSASIHEEESEDDAGGMDPFVPQERIFSKYAAMLYSSDNNGRTYHEFKDAKYCSSCLEKV